MACPAEPHSGAHLSRASHTRRVLEMAVYATLEQWPAQQLALPGGEGDYVVREVEQVSTLLACRHICARTEQKLMCWRLLG